MSPMYAEHAATQQNLHTRTRYAIACSGVALALSAVGCGQGDRNASEVSFAGQQSRSVERSYDLPPLGVYEARFDLASEMPFEVKIDPDGRTDVDLQVYHVTQSSKPGATQDSPPPQRVLFRFSELQEDPREQITAVFPAGRYTLVIENRDATRHASGRVITRPIELAWDTARSLSENVPFELHEEDGAQQHWLWVRERTRLSVRVTPASPPTSTAKARAPNQETTNTREPSIDAMYTVGLLASHVTGGESPSSTGDHAGSWWSVADPIRVASGQSMNLTSAQWIDPGLYFLGSTITNVSPAGVIYGAYEVRAENYRTLSMNDLTPSQTATEGSFRDQVDVGLGVGIHIYRIPSDTDGPLAVHLGNIPEGSDYELVVVDAQGREWGASTAYNHAPERVVLLSRASTVDLFALVILNDRNSELRAQPYRVWVDGNIGDQSL